MCVGELRFKFSKRNKKGYKNQKMQNVSPASITNISVANIENKIWENLININKKMLSVILTVCHTKFLNLFRTPMFWHG